jgi:RNA polymerase sigma factor (sigma-70 family)
MTATSVDAVLRYVRTLFAGRKAEGQTDQQLLQTFLSKPDEAVFATLLARHGPMVLGVCRRILHDEHLAEDAFQATFMTLAHESRAIRKRQSLGSWLHGVALRLARKAKAAAIRGQRPDPRSHSWAAPDPQAEASWREAQQILDDELHCLPDTYRLPLVLCYLEGLTRDEAAARLGWTAGKLKGLLERGRERLRCRLTRRGVTLASAASGVLLADTALSATVPPLLVVGTVQAGVRYAAGSALGACGIPPAVAALAKEGLTMMATKKLALTLAFALITCVITPGVGILGLSIANSGNAVERADGATNRETSPTIPAQTEHKAAKEKTDARLLGHWEIVSVKSGNPTVEAWFSNAETIHFGKETKLREHLILRKTNIVWKDGKVFALDYAVTQAGNSQAIDMVLPLPRGDRTDKDEQTYRGLYTVDDSTLKICVSPRPERRPKDFDFKQGKNRVLFVLKRPSQQKPDGNEAKPHANDDWQPYAKNRLIAVDIERCLYEVKGEKRFLMAVRLTNQTEVDVGVDVRGRHGFIYPNQWGVHDTNVREIVDERRIKHALPDKDKVRGDFQAGLLTRIPAGKSVVAFTEFNASGRADVDRSKGKFFIVSMNGLVTATDGKAVETIPCEAEVVLPFPVRWKTRPAERGNAKKDGLSLTIGLDKKRYRLSDEVKLSFKLKNETTKDLFVGDGWLAPKYHEAGPGRHFEVHITADRKSSLTFWTGMLTEGQTAGIRKVFKLKPGETFEGTIRISAGAEKDAEFAKRLHELRGGSLEDNQTRKKHVLGKDGRKYTLTLRYQVNPDSHGVHDPPAGFKEKLLWKGKVTSIPVEFEITDDPVPDPKQGPKSIRLPHEGSRISVAFSPDGKYLATGGQDNRIRLWHVATGKPALSIAAHRAPAGVSRLAFFPDGKTLASGSWAGDGTVKLWDVATGKESRLVGQDKGGIGFLAVSPNGKLLAWGNGGKIHIHYAVADKEAACLSIRSAVDSVAFSPDGATLASANGDGTVRLWELATSKAIRDFPARQSTATGSQAVAFSPDGKTLASAGREVTLWEVATGKEQAKLGESGEGVFYIAFSPNGRWLAAATYKALRLWNVATGKEARHWDEHVRSVAFSPDSKLLAFGSDGGATIVSIDGAAAPDPNNRKASPK